MLRFFFILLFTLQVGCQGCLGTTDTSRWADAMANGRVAYADARYDDASRSFEVAVLEAQEFPDKTMLTEALFESARARLGAGKPDKAEELLERSMGITKESFGEDDPAISRDLQLLAEVYVAQKKDARAETAFTRAIDLLKARNAPDAALARPIASFGRFLLERKRYAEAEPHLKRAVAIYEADMGSNAEQLVMLRIDLARVQRGQKQYDAAVSTLESALDAATTNLGTEHPLVASVYSHQGDVFAEIKKYKKAINAFTKAMDLCVSALGPEAPDCGTGMYYLAQTYHAAKDLDNAGAMYEKARPLREKVAKDEPARVANFYSDYAKLEDAREKPEEAAKLRARAAELLKAAGKGEKAKGAKGKDAKGKGKGDKAKGAKGKDAKGAKGKDAKGAKGKGGKGKKKN